MALLVVVWKVFKKDKKGVDTVLDGCYSVVTPQPKDKPHGAEGGNDMTPREAKAALIGRRQTVKATLKDIDIVIKAQEAKDWTLAHQTKLYQLHGPEYCELLEIIR